MSGSLKRQPAAPIVIPNIDDKYGSIEATDEYVQHMQALIHTVDELRKLGYIMRQFSGPDLDRKKRCQQCSRILPASFQKRPPKTPVITRPVTSEAKSAASSSSSSLGVADAINKATAKDPRPMSKMHCKFHPGKVAQKRWTCCNGNVFSPPCAGQDNHTPRIYQTGELGKEWRFYATPSPSPDTRPAAAVVIDCEMGVNQAGDSELIRISVIDYFSRAILLDSLVWPDAKMAHYNTRFSGVTRYAMENARRRRTCIFGRANARKAVWKFVGPDTIVVGHAGHGDLTSLRWIHPTVIDTLIIETNNRPPPPEKKCSEVEAGVEKDTETGLNTPAENVPPHNKGSGDDRQKSKEGGGLSLKALALQRLNRNIQLKGQGHDSLEDAIATRDVLHWNIVKVMNNSSTPAETTAG